MTRHHFRPPWILYLVKYTLQKLIYYLMEQSQTTCVLLSKTNRTHTVSGCVVCVCGGGSDVITTGLMLIIVDNHHWGIVQTACGH